MRPLQRLGSWLWWLRPPPPGDALTFRSARSLYWFAVTMIGAAVLWIPVTFVEPSWRAGLVPACVVAALWTSGLVLAQLGKLEASAAVLVGGLALVLPIGILLTGGVHSPSVSGFPVLVVAAGLLLGARAAGWLTAYSVAVLALLAGLGELPAFFLHTGATASATHAAVVLAAGGIAVAVLRRFDEDRVRLLENAEELEVQNHELVRMKERYREITDLTSEYFYSLARQPDGSLRAEMLNEDFADITGHDARAFEDGRWWQILHPDDHAAVRARERHRPSERPEIGEYRILTADGRTRWIRDHSRSVKGEDGVWRLYGASRDVTEEHAREEERQRLESELRQAQKMEAVGRLAGGIAHDFNNLLTVITGYGDLLVERTRHDPEAHTAAEQTVAAAERAAALTSRLLAFGRRDLEHETVFDAVGVLRGLSPMLERMLGETITVELTLAPEPLLVSGDPGLLEQVVLNLAVNARDALGGQGCVRIAATGIAIRDSERAELAPGDYVELEVEDEGGGMDEATATHAFEPFFTTKERGQGTGLGLSTVYGIVRQWKGAVLLDSEPGRGTRVAVALPRVEAEATPSCVPTAPPEAPAGKCSILVVEDDDRVRRVVHRLLEHDGHEVTLAPSGPEAIGCVRERGGAFDLVLSDVVMPGMDGVELMNELRRLRPELRFLLMSGYANTPGEVPRELPEGAGFLQKPFGPNELRARLAEVLAAPLDADAGRLSVPRRSRSSPDRRPRSGGR